MPGGELPQCVCLFLTLFLYCLGLLVGERWWAKPAKVSFAERYRQWSLQLIFCWPLEMCSPGSLRHSLIPVSCQPTNRTWQSQERKPFFHGRQQSKNNTCPTVKCFLHRTLLDRMCHWKGPSRLLQSLIHKNQSL